MKPLADLLIKKKALERQKRAIERKLEKINAQIAREYPPPYDESKAIDTIRAILQQGEMLYGDLHYQAYLHEMGGNVLRRLLKKYKGKHWDNRREGNKYWWSVSP